MDVVRIEIVDFHINSFLYRILGQPTGSFCSRRFCQHWFTIERGPDQMQPAARVGVFGHGAFSSTAVRCREEQGREYRLTGFAETFALAYNLPATRLDSIKYVLRVVVVTEI